MHTHSGDPCVWNVQFLFAIGSVLAGVACISSLILLNDMLLSWERHSSMWDLGLGELGFGQIVTGIYLKVRNIWNADQNAHFNVFLRAETGHHSHFLTLKFNSILNKTGVHLRFPDSLLSAYWGSILLVIPACSDPHGRLLFLSHDLHYYRLFLAWHQPRWRAHSGHVRCARRQWAALLHLVLLRIVVVCSGSLQGKWIKLSLALVVY